MDQTDASDFSSAARGALQFLHAKFGFGLWMVTRTEGDRSIVLEVVGDRDSIEPFSCIEAAAVPSVKGLLTGQTPLAGAYLGFPLVNHDGIPFGTLCAIDSKPQPELIEDELPLVEMVAKMLSGVLAAELRAVEAERQKERAIAEAETDPLTGLFNRAGWDRMIQSEEDRCKRYGDSAFVVLVDLDGLKAINETLGFEAGDKLIRRTAKVLRKSVRECDVVARLSADKFGILGTPCNPVVAEQILQRLRKTLERAGVRASLGMATRVPALHLGDLCNEADQLMYGEKTARKLRKTAGQLRRISRSKTYPFDSPGFSSNGEA